ncbi:hypothetical protein [Streptosporangium minutum]|uniref:Uncharacterized protein n=1 Tax=Streptosporangium minutum TaxID=569862 RepID=A0A243RVU5_9ACTN|nr:hypothetical protein [Streptosporangium minutum]OUC99310.1 hypothetical protein CA984_03630 [Streptosporangium minutum]
MGLASVRSVVATPIPGAAAGVAARGEGQPGDVILAIQSSDKLGGFADMTISGGGTWQPVDSLEGPNWAGTKISRKILTTAEPEQYTVTQTDANTYGTVIILVLKDADPAGILVVKRPGTVAPAATPVSASGLELRYGVGIVEGLASWAQLTGYEGLDVLSGVFITASLAGRPFASSSRMSALDLAPSPPIAEANSQAFTILVQSAGSAPGGGDIPTPPTFPAFTPTKGVARTSYTVHDFLTGELRGDIYPVDPTYDRRDGEAGGWSGFLPFASRRDADKIAEMIPRDPADLTSGPGRLVVHSWREGVPMGVHWIHTAEIAKSSRLGWGVQLQGTTLDGYMNSVSLEADVEFYDDQIQNARDLIAHMGLDPRSNPGFALQAGMSGLVRPLAAKQADTTTYGRVLRDYARAAGGFGYVINPTLVGGNLERRWAWGSPRLDFPDLQWTFTEARDGGEIIDWREVRSALQGGTRIGVIGGTPEQEDATQNSVAARSTLIETPHLAAGWPIIDLRINHPSASTDLTELERYAQRYAATAAGAPRVFSATVILGKHSDFDPNGIGGWVEFVMNNNWHIRTDAGGAFQMPAQRLIGWALTPAGRGNGKDRLQIITAQDTEAA